MARLINSRRAHNRRFEAIDAVLLIILAIWALVILLPFINVVAISLTGYKEYLESRLLLWPKRLDLSSYRTLFKDGRIWIGYRTTLQIVGLGVPLNIFLCASMAYGLSRRGVPGRKLLFYIVLLTMIFHGGIVPTYLVIKSMKLTNNIWSVVLVTGMNTFNMILIYNYFSSLPDSLMESARLDGAGEWRILFRIVLPLSMPIIATVLLFVAVALWNEYFMSMIFNRSRHLQPLQLVLRSIVIDSQVTDISSGIVDLGETNFTNGIKMCAVIVTMLPIMCVFPFLQKHFAKGIMVGAIKA